MSQPDLAVVHCDWNNIQEEDEEEAEELEPKMQFHLHGAPKVGPSSTSQSTETIPPGKQL